MKAMTLVLAVTVGVLATAPWHSAFAQGPIYGWGFNAGGGFGDCAANGIPNSFCGQTGVPDVPVVTMPTAVPAIPDAFALGGGMFHSLAVRADGTVWAWGMNGSGQLGFGGSPGAYSVTPVQVPGINAAIAVAGGWHQSHAIGSDGTLWSWGSAWTGLGSYSSHAPPTQLAGLAGVVSVAASETASYAVLSDGTLWSWGFNGNGQLGTGSFDSFAFSPVQITALQNVSTVATHFAHALALKNDGTVWAWGYNSNGQLGDGTRFERRTPVQVAGLNNVVQIATGGFNSYALRDDGTVWTWGHHGCCLDILSPVPVGGFEGIGTIVAGGSHLLARAVDGTLLGWGSNEWGQLGLATVTAFEWVPTPVVGLGPVGPIAAGRTHSLAGALIDTTPPSLVVENITVDGTSPEGALVEYSVTALDDIDPNPIVNCVPPSGSQFPMWVVTTVYCTASDAAGNTGYATFDVIIKDPVWQLQDVLDLIQSWNLGRLGTSLTDKLTTAQRFLLQGKSNQACDNLRSILNQVASQTGKALTIEEGTDLITRVTRIRDVIGC